MNSKDFLFWQNYWQDKQITGTDDLQKNVGRTKNGKTIDTEIWNKTVNDISKILKLDKSMKVMELCCGNGQLIGNIAPYCKKAVGVDYSKDLLKQMTENFNHIVDPIYDDVLNVNFEKNAFDRILIYFALQHFDEKESLTLIINSLNWLKEGGQLFIGDIPDENKKWDYIRNPEHQKDYLERILEGRPKVGNWFQQEFFKALPSIFNGITVKILEQPSYQINSSHRFDVLISKQQDE